ncbi:hypothetical protein AN958_04776 [Leucoagaricus sp. SymC.cos]|nr:hypothetical protein AN958_04776 [Leucoagaricus sp. SymC.cos]
MPGNCFKHIYETYLLSEPVTDLDQYPFLDAPHSDLYEGQWNNQHIALKRWRVSKASEEQTKKTLQKLNDWRLASCHPNILPFFGLCESNGRVPALILPKMRCHIAQYVSRNPFVDKYILVYQLSEALLFLHNRHRPIVHGSIKDTNILISWDYKLRLSDIGVYATLWNPEMSQDWRPSDRPRFQSPEQLMRTGDELPQPSTDVWSFGMVVLQVFSGSLPYGHLQNSNTAILQIAQGILPPKPDESVMSSELWQLLSCCWKFDPHLRPSMSSILPCIRLLREHQRPRD